MTFYEAGPRLRIWWKLPSTTRSSSAVGSRLNYCNYLMFDKRRSSLIR